MRTALLAAAVAALLSAPVHAEPTKGEVTRIDAKAGRITLRHEPIRNLDMDRMTMVFRVASPDMLAALKVGDRVVFEAARVDGALTVTRIRKEE